MDERNLAASKPKVPPRRRALYAKIHIAKKQLGMSEQAYRALLAQRFGVDSSVQLSTRGLVRLASYFDDLGFVSKTKYSAADNRKLQLKKIWALSYALGRPVPAYADAVAKKMYNIDKVVWCDPVKLRGIISALNAYLKKEKNNG